MASNKEISLNQLPDPHDLIGVEDLPSPEELNHSLPQKLTSKVQSAIEAVKPQAQEALDLGGNVLNSGLDFARGLGQGLTFGASDELGGALSALGEAAYNKFNPTDAELEAKGFDIQHPNLPDLYRKNQQSIQKEFEGSSERSPWLYAGGQIGGGVTSGSALGGLLKSGAAAEAAAPKLLDIYRNEGKMKALAELGLRGFKNYKEAAPVIAAESALSSKHGGVLNGDEREALLKDTAGGLLFGIPAVAGMTGFSEVGAPAAKETASKLQGKISDLVQETPLLRQMKVAYGYGTEGINPKSQQELLNTSLGKTALSELDNQRTSKLMNEIYAAEDKIGKGVTNSLEQATAQGKNVNIGPDITGTLQQVSNLASKYPEIQTNPRAMQIFNKIAQGENHVTPLEAKDLIDYMDAYIGKFKASTNITPAEQGILSNLYQARQQFSNTLKTAIPEYANAAERYQQFRRLVPETIMAGERPVGVIQGEGFKNIRDEDKKVFDALKKLNQGTTREGEAVQSTKEAFVNTIKGLKTFEQQEANRFAKGQINDSAFARTAGDIEKEILKNSDDAVARGAIDALQPSAGVSTTLGKSITGVGGTGRSVALSAANIAGRVQNKISSSTVQNPVSKVVRSVYQAPNDAVLSLSQKLKAAPGLEKYGTALESALNSPDSNRRNQVLFTIMQNPNARAFVKDEHEEPSTEGSYEP